MAAPIMSERPSILGPEKGGKGGGVSPGPGYYIVIGLQIIPSSRVELIEIAASDARIFAA